MKEKIGNHNAKVLKIGNSNEDKTCNCRNKNECPIPGECNLKSVVYQAKVYAENKVMNYFGSTERPFKKR